VYAFPSLNLSVDAILLNAKERINKLEPWEPQNIAHTLKDISKDLDQPSKVIMKILRYALVGLEPGVGVPVIIEILGKEKACNRLERCRSYVK
jgi:glutamyl/glutaminyl-tRNA synthetase